MLCGEETKHDLLEKALKDSEFQLILNANPASRLRVEAGAGVLKMMTRNADSFLSFCLDCLCWRHFTYVILCGFVDTFRHDEPCILIKQDLHSGAVAQVSTACAKIQTV